MNNPKIKGGIDQLIKDRFLLNDWNKEEIEEDYTQDDIDADIAEHEREIEQ